MTSTSKSYCKRESATASSQMPRSSVIYVNSTGDSIEDWLTSLRQDSPVSPTLTPGNVPEKTMTETSGPIPDGALARYDPDTSYWRTSQVSFLTGILEPLWENFPNSATMRHGVLYPQKPLAHRTSEKGGGVSPGWPTPNVSDSNGANMKDDHDVKRNYLRGMVLKWPTPTYMNDSFYVDNSPKSDKRHSRGLASEVEYQTQNWPTPTMSDHKGSGPTIIRKDGKSRMDRLDYVTEQTSAHGGKLNPTWVEWLMGLPLGWTDLKPLETESYQRWWQSFCGE